MQQKEYRDETPLSFFSQNEKRDEKAMEAALWSRAERDKRSRESTAEERGGKGKKEL